MITTLTITTPVPTHARGALRAFIRQQSGFQAWCQATGVMSHNVKNSDLIQFALENALEDAVLAIINHPSVASSVTGASDDFDADGALENLMEIVPVKANAIRDGVMEASTDLNEILKPVEPFLSPLVRKELEKALKPLVDAANKPPVEKIVERFTVTNLSPLPAGATPYATPDKQSTLGALFNVRGQYAKTPVMTWESHGAAPKPDAFYVVDPQLMFELATAADMGVNVWFTGPSGSGKSTAPVQFCGVTGRPCVKFGFTRQTEIADLIGGPAVLTDGSTQWQDGALIQAMKRPGTFIVCDELSIAPAGVQAIIQLVSDDHRSITLPTGEVVVCAPGVVFVVADNTNGTGDSTGQYHGTNPVNQALVNRFGYMINVDYMSKGAEAKALHNHTGAAMPACDLMADFVARARKLPEMEGMVLSLRQMTAFVKAVQKGWTVKRAAVASFLSRMPQAERAALETLFTLAWSGEFANALTGTSNDPVQTEPIMGRGNADHGAFDDNVTQELNRV